MDRASSLRRRIYVLGALSVALAAILVLRPSRTVSSPEESRLVPTFAALDVAKVRALEVQRPGKDGAPGASIRLARASATSWTVESAGDYPADEKKVEDFLRGLSSVRTKSTPTLNPAKFHQFAGADGWTDVRVYEDAATPTISFGIGKSGAEGSWSTLYLRVDDPGLVPAPAPSAAGAAEKARPGRIVAATGLDAYADRTDVTSWVEARLFPGLSEGDLVEVAWEHAPKSWSGRLVRGKKGEKDTEDPWTLEGPGGGRAKAAEAKLRAQQLAGLRFEGVQGKGAGDASAWGFDKPDLVVTGTGRPAKEGDLPPTWRLVLGRKVEGKPAWYAKREGPAGADPWVFVVGETETSWFRQDPKSLLDVPPPPPEAGMDGGMAEGAAMGEAPAMEGEAPAPAVPAMGEAPATEGEAPAMGETPAMEGAPGMGQAGTEAPPAGK
jgi:hypothetical protein